MEYMIRWKRTAKNKWYYLPRVYVEPTEPKAFVQKRQDNLYRCEVVAINPVAVYEETNDEANPDEPSKTPTAPVQPTTVVAKIQEARRRSRKSL